MGTVVAATAAAVGTARRRPNLNVLSHRKRVRAFLQPGGPPASVALTCKGKCRAEAAQVARDFGLACSERCPDKPAARVDTPRATSLLEPAGARVMPTRRTTHPLLELKDGSCTSTRLTRMDVVAKTSRPSVLLRVAGGESAIGQRRRTMDVCPAGSRATSAFTGPCPFDLAAARIGAMR